MNEHIPDFSAAISYRCASDSDTPIQRLAAHRPLRVLRTAAIKWIASEHRLQFFSVMICATFSLAPAILVMLAMLVMLSIETIFRDDTFVNLGGFVGDERATLIRNLLLDVGASCRSGLSTLISLFLIVIIVSFIYLQIHRIFNSIWLLHLSTSEKNNHRSQPIKNARLMAFPGFFFNKAIGLSFLSISLIVVDAASRWLVNTLSELTSLDSSIYIFRIPLCSAFAGVTFVEFMKRMKPTEFRWNDVLGCGAVVFALFASARWLLERCAA